MAKRYVTILGIVLGVLAILAHLTGIATEVQPYLTDGGIIFIGAGVVTGY
jgi:hypothetical protein